MIDGIDRLVPTISDSIKELRDLIDELKKKAVMKCFNNFMDNTS